MKLLAFTSICQNFINRIYNRLHRKNALEKIQNILNTAQSQRKLVLSEAQSVLQERFTKDLDQLNQYLEQKQKEIDARHAALSLQQSKLDMQSNVLQSKETALSEQVLHIECKSQELIALSDQLSQSKTNLESALVTRACCSRAVLFDDIKDVWVKTHTLDLSRLSIERQEQLKQDAHKIANKTLQSVYYRYQPRFVWPKSSFLVNFNNQNLVEKYFSEESPILKLLLEGTDTTLSVLATTAENAFTVKIAGGLGVDKEIIRKTLEECSAKKILHPDKILAVRTKNQTLIENQILQMGSEAAKILDLNKLHPEILKLIGSLNFRTSHRQNQYRHSLEVATLAGMIAEELGVDQKLAKRSGLLHDIGKVLDYKIEGGHAVISGDYASKYFETEDVVDTILAHHDDKIVDTPHAFILKAADAMSGARPGARVDMEEGYNRRLDGISAVVQSFQGAGVTDSAIMHAGREVHVYVDNKKTPHNVIDTLARDIAEKLESDVEYPGQIRVTVIRRMEITAVA